MPQLIPPADQIYVAGHIDMAGSFPSSEFDHLDGAIEQQCLVEAALPSASFYIRVILMKPVSLLSSTGTRPQPMLIAPACLSITMIWPSHILQCQDRLDFHYHPFFQSVRLAYCLFRSQSLSLGPNSIVMGDQAGLSETALELSTVNNTTNC